MTDTTAEIAPTEGNRKRLRPTVRRAKNLHRGWMRHDRLYRGGDVYVISHQYAPDVIPEYIIGLTPGELLDDRAEVKIDKHTDYRHFDLVEGSEHLRLIAFQSEQQEKANTEYEAKRRAQREKKLRRRRYIAKETPEERKARLEKKKKGEAWVLAHTRNEEEAQDRLNGFFFPGGTVAGQWYNAFEEHFGSTALRCRLPSPSLRRWAQIVNKVARMRVGADKTTVAKPSKKIFGMDAPYIQLDPRYARCLAIDLDGVWSSFAEFRADLLKKLGGNERMMPNLIVGRFDADGRFCRPHLIWLFKQERREDGTVRDSSVWLDFYVKGLDGKKGKGDKRCRTSPIGYLNQIRRGLTMLLLPLGADPQWKNVLKPKNPASPFWSTFVTNDDYWPELGDFRSIPGLRMDVTDPELKEAFGLMRSLMEGASAKTSNLLWKTVGQVLEPKVRTALSQREPSFVAAGQAGLLQLAAWFEERVRPIVMELLTEEFAEDEKTAGHLDRTLRRRCEFAAKYCFWKGKPGRRTAHRGRDRDVFFGTESAKERRRVASKRTGEHRTFVASWELLTVLTPALQDGKARTKAQIVKEASGIVSQSFVYKHFDRIVAKLGLEFRDGAYRYIVSSTPSSQVSTKEEDKAAILSEPAVIPSVLGRSALKSNLEADSGSPDDQSAVRPSPKPALELA